MTTRTLAVASLGAFLGLIGSVQVQSQGPQSIQKPLPEGPAKELVMAECTRCHGLNQINNAGFSRAEWDEVLKTMVRLPSDQHRAIVDYLAANFPGGKKPAANIIPGPVTVSIKEWLVPSLGSRPHDPAEGNDGSLWWTGQWADVLGRLDVKTGEMKEFPLKTPKVRPHGLVSDKEGSIWYTGNGAALVGKLNPKTGEVTEYKMPDPAARDPHTPIVDQKGNVWFTLQGANMVGRIVPSTGEVKVVSPPTPKSNPYGIVVDSKGTPWFVQFNLNQVASIDPSTMEIKEYKLPNAETRPRRVAITEDDVLWLADYARGYLGRFDTKTAAYKEWASPGGPRSQLYGIAATPDGVIWYSEAGVAPNTLVRFDPTTEKFQTWAIPSGGGVVRNMVATRDGNLMLACSGRNQVAYVQVAGRPASQ